MLANSVIYFLNYGWYGTKETDGWTEFDFIEFIIVFIENNALIRHEIQMHGKCPIK